MIDKAVTVRKRRICYINSDTKTLETSAAFFEKRLHMLSNIELTEYTSMDLLKEGTHFDLLIINASNLNEPAFLQWFSKVALNIPKQFSITTPTLFYSRVDFAILDELWESIYKNNWYFDIIHPDHLESLPIRVANLLRIYDHLHEIHRYEKELQNLKMRMIVLEKQIEKMSPR